MKREDNGLKEFIIAGIIITLIATLFVQLVEIWVDWFHNQ